MNQIPQITLPGDKSYYDDFNEMMRIYIDNTQYWVRRIRSKSVNIILELPLMAVKSNSWMSGRIHLSKKLMDVKMRPLMVLTVLEFTNGWFLDRSFSFISGWSSTTWPFTLICRGVPGTFLCLVSVWWIRFSFRIPLKIHRIRARSIGFSGEVFFFSQPPSRMLLLWIMKPVKRPDR